MKQAFAACALALTPTVSALAMPVAAPEVIGVSDGVIQVKGGHGRRSGDPRPKRLGDSKFD